MIAHPFVKWAGGKRQIAHLILARLPARIRTYHEPFVGAGAVFFALAAAERLHAAVLNDRNAELIAAYRQLIAGPDALIDALQRPVFQHDEKAYYAARAMDPHLLDETTMAARFVYLNRCGFNGLYRVNRAGVFNVPFGRATNPTICDRDNLIAAHQTLQRTGAVARCGDFAAALVEHPPEPEDAVYFDPPYWPIDDTANFVGYQAGGFGPAEQTRLRDVALRLKADGIAVLLSNADVPAVRELYRDFRIDRVEVRRAINKDASKRGPVGEVLIS